MAGLAFFGAVMTALFFGQKAKTQEKETEIQQREKQDAESQRDQLINANNALHAAQEQGKKEVEDAVKKADSGGNTFNDW